MRATIAAWWIRRDLRKCLRTVRRMPEASRQWMAGDIHERARILAMRRSLEHPTSPAWLEERLAGDTTRRQLALRDGATSRTDPRWLRAAILEAWTFLLIYEARGAVAAGRVRQAEEEIAAAFPAI